MPAMDFVITVCDNAAGEVCPVWPGHPMTAHWGVPDPARVAGSDDAKRAAFAAAASALEARIRRLVALPLARARPCRRGARGTRRSPMTRAPEAGRDERPARRARSSPRPAIGFFERWLTAWVALCIVAGIALGQWFPAPVKALGELQIAHVNLPVGALIWVMIVPMLMRIDFGALRQVTDHWRGIGVTLFVNWAVKPFSMALLAWIFVRGVFAPWLPAEQLDSYVAGLILLAAAPCTAMVFVWSQLTRGDPYFTLSQVALNDLIMVFAFAPIVGLLLGLSAIVVPWDTLLASVVLYIVVPLALAQLARRALLARGPQTLGCRAPAIAAVVDRGAARHPRAAVRVPGRGSFCGSRW